MDEGFRVMSRAKFAPFETNPYETPFRPVLPASIYALTASRHMYKIGTTREQIAAVAAAARQ